MAVLPRRFYARPALDVAQDLLGHELVWRGEGGTLGGIIVEVEAYGGADDPASHAFRGATARNRTMFGPPGHAYVYFTYGMHHCVNVVTGRAGEPGAVLVRALAPRTHLALWRARRPDLDPLRIASGPGRVCRALGLGRVHDGLDLTKSALVIRRRARAGTPSRVRRAAGRSPGARTFAPSGSGRRRVPRPWRRHGTLAGLFRSCGEAGLTGCGGRPTMPPGALPRALTAAFPGSPSGATRFLFRTVPDAIPGATRRGRVGIAALAVGRMPHRHPERGKRSSG
jgi:DNA-3-methyladenine glycosylase